MSPFFVLLITAAFVGSEAAHWTHLGEHGTHHWAEMFAECAGSSQSPINIYTSKNNEEFVYDENLTADLDVVTGNDVDNYFLVNNAHTVYVDTSAAEVDIFGANLGKTYRVVGPHFHWGSKNTQGSEHTFNDIQFPLELHIVTYDAEKYADIKEAVGSNEAGALAVVGVMFKISEEDNPVLAPIIDNMDAVKQPDKENKVSIPFFPLKDLLPDERSEYFRYAGSLTTPTCNEVVTWTVMLHAQTISQSQLDKLRSVFASVDDEGATTTLVDNYRPVQPLNGRKVYKSFATTTVEYSDINKINAKRRTDPEPASSSSSRNLIGRFASLVAMVTVTAAILL